MNLSQYRAIAPALNADLRAAFEKHGLKVAKINAAVDEIVGTVTVRLQLADMCLTDASGEATTPERQRWHRDAAMFGLDVGLLDQPIRLNGRLYIVKGLLSIQSEKCVSILRDDGKSFRCTAKDLRRAAPVGA
jgi:hypothetical protein